MMIKYDAEVPFKTLKGCMCITREETENKMTARAPSSVKLKNGCFLKEVRGPAEVVTEISASRPKILLIINFIIT